MIASIVRSDREQAVSRGAAFCFLDDDQSGGRSVGWGGRRAERQRQGVVSVRERSTRSAWALGSLHESREWWERGLAAGSGVVQFAGDRKEQGCQGPWPQIVKIRWGHRR